MSAADVESPRTRACGIISLGRVQALEAAGLLVVRREQLRAVLRGARGQARAEFHRARRAKDTLRIVLDRWASYRDAINDSGPYAETVELLSAFERAVARGRSVLRELQS